jgi:NADH dehydrogenase FAD-containing subunit
METPVAQAESWPQVVIVGGGFGVVRAAKALIGTIAFSTAAIQRMADYPNVLSRVKVEKSSRNEAS